MYRTFADLPEKIKLARLGKSSINDEENLVLSGAKWYCTKCLENKIDFFLNFSILIPC